MKNHEFLNDHPELKNESKKIETILEDFPSPETEISPEFTKKIKSEIKTKIQEKKAQNPKYLAFYLHHFRFYFSGFSVALGAFMILFVL